MTKKRTINIRIPYEQYIMIDSEAKVQEKTKTEVLRKARIIFFK